MAENAKVDMICAMPRSFTAVQHTHAHKKTAIIAAHIDAMRPNACAAFQNESSSNLS
eukprot:CAMPEP_0116005304 /NCGR_PEP_ID=MMETSP0321-20121206/1093_1 /TAXON_ID=163516 /ORGANISM="Leptocylindrus danicus var. danicus, Strain B650" /LENGTH=56 /DNA_ID=CAMNT_0003473721 /DNA_START=448 /DNA_END=615 /DNA_ORIENTATION=+